MTPVSILALILAAQTVTGGLKSANPVTPEVKARQQALRSAAANIDKAGPDLLPLIESSLQDSDAHVRFLAIGALTQLNMKIATGGGQQRPSPSVDPRGRASLQTVLLQTLNDADPRLRGGAAKALAFVAPPPNATVRPALVAAYQREREAGVRAAILSEFGTYSPNSTDVQQIIVSAITDVSPQVRRTAAMVVAKSRPPAALQGVVAELRSGSPETRAEFLLALSSYGAAAKPHLDVLETLLRSETRPPQRLLIQRAIATIQGSR